MLRSSYSQEISISTELKVGNKVRYAFEEYTISHKIQSIYVCIGDHNNVINIEAWQLTLIPNTGYGAIEEHNGHNVIDNIANHKPFRYCKDCKVEV
jgi:hypothetical protein